MNKNELATFGTAVIFLILVSIAVMFDLAHTKKQVKQQAERIVVLEDIVINQQEQIDALYEWSEIATNELTKNFRTISKNIDILDERTKY